MPAERRELNRILNSNPDQSSTQVVVGGSQPIPNTDISYRPVYNPATRETVIVRQTYNSGPRNSKVDASLDLNNRIATLGPNNRWIPTEYARTIGGQPLIDSINSTSSTSAAASFNTARDRALQDDSRNINNRALTTQQLTSQRRSADANSPSMTTNTNVLGTSRTGLQQQQQPGNSTQPDGTVPPGGTPPDPQQQTTDARGSGSVVGNRSAAADAVSTVVSIDSLTGSGQAATGGAGAITYPLSFPDNMDYIKFIEKDYGKKTFNSSNLSFGVRLNTATGNSVILPIQTGISDANTVGWNEETFNPAQIAGSQLAIGGIRDGMDGFVGQIGNVVDKMKNANTDIEKAIIAYFTEQAVGVQILPKIGGAIFNPNTELLFQGPQLRSFNFSFRLTPRSKDESIRVKQILRFFKSGMAAQTTEKELFLKAPKVFKIEFYHGGSGQEHSGIGKIKDCALQACNVDYTPDGSYMSFKDGGMVSYTVNLQFMELEPIYAKDYNESDNHPIGY